MRSTIGGLVAASVLTASVAGAQSARDALGAAAIEPLTNEPPAKIIIDPPLAESLTGGRVVIQYRAINLHIVPVFGATALAVSPRVGHVHVMVDDAGWVWADASGGPVIVNGLPPGPHTVRIQLETANHQLLDQGSVTFTVPEPRMTPSAAPDAATGVNGKATAQSSENEPPAKIIVGAPEAEPLSRGVAFINYHTENLQIVPIYGPAALAVSPRVGHLHIFVDGLPWRWLDASGNPIIIQGLTPGRHTVLVQLVNANHHPLDQGTVELTIPARPTHIGQK